MTSSEMVVVVPVREGSSRIKDKNFLPFADDPTLVHRKLRQLREAGCFDHIYVSSDSARARGVAAECGVEFLPRDPLMCTSRPRWDEVVVHILQTVPGDPHVAWAMVTSPLFERYAEAVQTYRASADTYDSLVGVKPIREYLIDEQGRPLFYSFGPWHPYSNELPMFYAINDAIFIARKADQLAWRYWIGRKPRLFPCDWRESIDVNFPEDLDMAQAVHRLAPQRAAA